MPQLISLVLSLRLCCEASVRDAHSKINHMHLMTNQGGEATAPSHSPAPLCTVRVQWALQGKQPLKYLCECDALRKLLCVTRSVCWLFRRSARPRSRRSKMLTSAIWTPHSAGRRVTGGGQQQGRQWSILVPGPLEELLFFLPFFFGVCNWFLMTDKYSYEYVNWAPHPNRGESLGANRFCVR